MMITLHSIARKFVGLSERPGAADTPQILAMLQLDASWPAHDEVAWCSAFVNYCAFLIDLPRSRSLGARSWLPIGLAYDVDGPVTGFEVVVLQRGAGEQPGPDVLEAPGHVGCYLGRAGADVLVLGGNQGNKVSVARFPARLVLGVRQLRW